MTSQNAQICEKHPPIQENRYSFIQGDAVRTLASFPENSVDCVITSPPYYRLRDYDVKDSMRQYLIGEEPTVEDYVKNLAKVFEEILRIIKPSGALWLNMGDKYDNKELMGLPWMVAFALKRQGWILRDDIIWNQIKGTQSVKDRMRDSYEHLFFFVKNKKYYFDADKIRIKHSGEVTIKNGSVVSASGVTGKKYREQIHSSDLLNEKEKSNALCALEYAIKEMYDGEIVDFRMTIRGVQRTYHSESGKISGRAKELGKKGFFIMKMRSRGFLPSNIWNIVPEDEWRKDSHCAVFPKALVDIPIKSTCPPNGLVLDPFCGTGTTVLSAVENDCRGVGIDISESYLKIASQRLEKCLI